MPSVKELQRMAMKKQPPENRIEYLAALFALLIVCDNYILTKKDNGIKLIVYKNILSHEFNVANEFELTQPLGDWLVSLPKGIWEEK